MDPCSYRVAMEPGSMIREYRVEDVLGSGGFGITYLAWDTNLEKHVAVKELMPSGQALRQGDGAVTAASDDEQPRFEQSRERFIQEARTLARFSHPNIVRVNRYFAANGTAYVVMDYERGEPLNQVLKRVGRLDVPSLRQLLEPLLNGLSAVHDAGFLHRDIKPHNIMLRKGGAPVLIDFGAARQATGGGVRPLTSIVTPGYAPLEQYLRNGEQGPWTDIYALAAVLYCAMTQEQPPAATSRREHDLVPAALARVRGAYSDALIAAVSWGLALDPRKRPRSIEHWRTVLDGGAQAFADASTVEMRRKPPSMLRRAIAAGVAAALTVCAGIALSGGLRPDPGVAVEPEALVAPTAPTQRSPAPPEAAPAEAAPAEPAPPPRAPVAVEKPAPARKAHERAPKQPVAITAEAAPAISSRAASLFARWDANGDGVITRDETELHPKLARHFDEADTNRDGKVSLRELENIANAYIP